MKSKLSKILITGGAGFIGSHLAERLCAGNKVIIFDNLRRNSLSQIPELKAHPNVKFIKGDILDKRKVANAAKGCDIVIHLAAIAGVSSYYKEPAKTLRVNLIGTINLLEYCKSRGIRKFIYFSTSEVYGQDALYVNEESPNNIGPISDLRWSYATSKLASEHLVLRYGEEYGFKAFTVRPFNIYGPRQTGEGAISNFLRSVTRNEPMVVNGDGSPIRAWCYVSDCIDAVEVMVNNDALSGGVFNIGNPLGKCTTLELARLVNAVSGKDAPIIFKKMKNTEIRVRIPNIGKAKRLLGFRPKVGLKAGLKILYRHNITKGE